VEPTVLVNLAEPPQPSLNSRLLDAAQLLIGDGAVDVRVADLTTSTLCIVRTPFLFADMRIRMVLLHDMHVQILGDILGEPFHDLAPLILLARHDEVAEQHALLGYPIRGEAQIADLGVHGLDALLGRLGVAFRFQEALGGAALPDLEVGQVDVDEAVEELEGLERVEGGGVVDDGQIETHVARGQDGEDDLGHDVLGRDEVDVVHAADVLELEVPLGELFGGQVEAVALVGDVLHHRPVLSAIAGPEMEEQRNRIHT